MTVHRAKPNILTDLGLELFIYRVLLLSPFEILRNQQFATTWRVKFYVYTSLLAYAALRVFFCILLVHSNKLIAIFVHKGALWMLIETFDYILAAISIGGIGLNGLVTSKYQIKFYRVIHEFDLALAADFKLSVRRSRTRTINRYALIAGLAYWLGEFVYTWMNYAEVISTSSKFAFLFTYYVSNIAAFVSAFHFVNCTQLCRERLASVVNLLRSCSSDPTARLDKIMQLYASIRRQVLLMNKFMGFVVLLRVFHDLTICTSIVFLVCRYDPKITFFMPFMWWLGQTVIGTLLMTLVADILMTEINECAAIVTSLNTTKMRVSSQKMVHNFLLLVRHRSPVLSACSFFHVDLRLLFAMGCAMVSYLFVLLQFKQYEDTL